MTFGSLFSGIGGLDLGLERAGLVCRWQVEKDEFCRKVLAKHWPEVPKYGDITEVRGSELERVDLLAGGFPCTDTSNAGRRAGINGERSGRWLDMLRILRVLGPFFVLVENPPGLLSRGMGDVLGGLAESGYDAEWICIPASAVGAKHQRERVFILAYPCGSGPALAEQIAAWRRCGRRWDSADRSDYTVPMANVERARLEGNKCCVLAPRESIAGHATRRSGGFAGIASRKDGALESWILRGVHGVPHRMDRVRTLGNAVVPQVAQWIGERLMELHERSRIWNRSGIGPECPTQTGDFRQPAAKGVD